MSSEDGVMVELVALLPVYAMTNSSTVSRYPNATFVPVRSMMIPISDETFPFPISMIASFIVVFTVSIAVTDPLTSKFPPTMRLSCKYVSPKTVRTFEPMSST